MSARGVDLKSFIAIILILLPSLGFCQTNFSKEAYELIEFLLKDEKGFKLKLEAIPFNNDHFKMVEILNRPFFKENMFLLLIDIDTVISEEQFKQLRKNVSSSSNLKRFSKEYLPLRSKFIFKDKDVKESQNVFPDFSTYEISFPIFSDDGNIGVLYYEQYCGIECGGGQLNIYMKTKNRCWILIGAIPFWVS